jgi:hypothetical protein
MHLLARNSTNIKSTDNEMQADLTAEAQERLRQDLERRTWDTDSEAEE